MKKLLNTLYITSDDKYLALEDENVAVYQGEVKVAQYPLIILEAIISFSYKGASPALMGACAKNGIQLVFLTPRGRFLARTCGMEHGNVLMRRTQYRTADDRVAACRIARNFIFGKTYNQRWVIERTLRDHALRVNEDKLRKVTKQIAAALPVIAEAEDIDVLRGLEGETSSAYFSVFDEMILSQKSEFTFSGRNRRPPKDNVNALLSFAYMLLVGDCTSSLESVGLDAYVGFMHTDRPGRASLALDLVEELRAPIADRLVLSLINQHMIKDKHFDHKEDSTVYLNEEGRKVLLQEWQKHKQETIMHPYLKEKVPWGLVPYAQAQLLSRLLRGDLDGYPPFLWK